jgi:hypothetical protein
MFGQIGATGRKVGGHFGQKWPNFENFAWTKMGGFGKFWDQTFMGIIRGPTEISLHPTCPLSPPWTK